MFESAEACEEFASARLAADVVVVATVEEPPAIFIGFEGGEGIEVEALGRGDPVVLRTAGVGG